MNIALSPTSIYQYDTLLVFENNCYKKNVVGALHHAFGSPIRVAEQLQSTLESMARYWSSLGSKEEAQMLSTCSESEGDTDKHHLAR